MAAQDYKGGAKQTALNAPITNSDMTFTVTAGGGTGYPTGSGGNFVVAIDTGLASEEKVLCSARSSDTFTVATGGRGYDDTSAAAHSNLAKVDHVLDAATLRAMSVHINTTTAAHAASAISYAGSTNLVATTVEAALDELDTEKIAVALVDAKGDLIVGSAADTVIRKAVGANGTVFTANSGVAGGVEWAVPVTGIIAAAYYDPATMFSQTSTSSTFNATHTTNLRASFTVPANGKVIVKFGAFLIAGNPAPSATAYPSLGVLSGSTVVAVAAGYNYPQFGYMTASKLITGLTPGASLNYDLALASGYPSATAMTLQCGGGLDTNGYGAAFVEVHAAP